jgi:hypothetical protein
MRKVRVVEVPASDIRPGDLLVSIGAQTGWGIHTWVVARSGKKEHTETRANV